jgi:hypothetical protein
MKIFILFFLFLGVDAFACVSDMKSDFKKNFDLKNDLQWKIIPVKLNSDDLEDYFVSSEEQCGGKRCEGIVYLQESKNCFINVKTVEGSFSVEKKRTHGFYDIKINSRVYKFDKWKNKYD